MLEFIRLEFMRLGFVRLLMPGASGNAKIDITKFKTLADANGLTLCDSNGYVLRSRDRI